MILAEPDKSLLPTVKNELIPTDIPHRAPRYLISLLEGINRSTAIKIAEGFQQLEISFDQQLSLFMLLNSSYQIEKNVSVDAQLMLNKLGENTQDTLNLLLQEKINQSQENGSDYNKLILARLLTLIDIAHISPKTKELLGWDPKNTFEQVQLAYENSVRYHPCPDAEERMIQAMQDGGYLLIRHTDRKEDAGILVKMWGKPLGIVTRTLQIGRQLVIPGSILAIKLGSSRDVLKESFFNNNVDLPRDNQKLEFVFQRMVDGAFEQQILQTARKKILTTTNLPVKIGGKTRQEYFQLLRE